MRLQVECATPKDLPRHYAEVRRRLRNPAHAKPDTPVLKSPPISQKTALKQKPTPVVVRTIPIDLSYLKTLNAGCPITANFGFVPHYSRGPHEGELATITKVVSEHFGVTKNDLCSKCRTLRIVRPRQIAMYLAREMTTKSFPAIGRAIGDRDHTTAMWAHEQISEKMITDPMIKCHVDTLRRVLGGLLHG